MLMGQIILVVALVFILLFALRRRALARFLRIERPRHSFTSRRVLVPGAEGSSLETRVYQPNADGVFPVVVIRTPYGLGWDGGPPGIVNHIIAGMFCERGVIVVMQSCRGRFASTGDFVPFVYEHDDGTLLLDWVAAQSWAQGPIVVYGQSYAGYTGWAIADDKRVNGFIAVQTSAEFRSILHADNAFSLETALRFLHVMETFGNDESPALWRGTRDVVRQTAAVSPACQILPVVDSDKALLGREDVHFRRALLVDDADDPFWRAIDHRERRTNVSAPTLIVAGFLDPFVREGVRDFLALQDRAMRARLIIGPWPHGQLDARYLDELFQFMRAPASLSEEPVRIVLNDFRTMTSSTWPPPSTTRDFTLHAVGNLDEGGAPIVGARDWTHHPDTPVPNVSGAILDLENAGVRDNRVLERRSDVVLFSTPPLDRDVVVVGEPTLRVCLHANRPTSDLFVRILDVAPDGTSKDVNDDSGGVSNNVTDAFIRVVDDELLNSNGVPLTLRFWPTGHVFKRGHRIRLLVAGAAHPRWARNLGTAAHPLTTTVRVPIDLTLMFDIERPSVLSLPVVDDAVVHSE